MKKHLSLLRKAFWLACLVVGVLSLTPTEYLSSGVFNWWDKAQHVLAFLVLGVLGLFAYPISVRRVVIGLILYGGVIELAQSATGWRYGDVADWGADATGVLASYVLILLLRRGY